MLTFESSLLLSSTISYIPCSLRPSRFIHLNILSEGYKLRSFSLWSFFRSLFSLFLGPHIYLGSCCQILLTFARPFMREIEWQRLHSESVQLKMTLGVVPLLHYLFFTQNIPRARTLNNFPQVQGLSVGLNSIPELLFFFFGEITSLFIQHKYLPFLPVWTVDIRLYDFMFFIFYCVIFPFNVWYT